MPQTTNHRKTRQNDQFDFQDLQVLRTNWFDQLHPQDQSQEPAGLSRRDNDDTATDSSI